MSVPQEREADEPQPEKPEPSVGQHMFEVGMVYMLLVFVAGAVLLAVGGF